jgi:hypothetical protein
MLKNCNWTDIYKNELNSPRKYFMRQKYHSRNSIRVRVRGLPFGNKSFLSMCQDGVNYYNFRD